MTGLRGWAKARKTARRVVLARFDKVRRRHLERLAREKGVRG